MSISSSKSDKKKGIQFEVRPYPRTGQRIAPRLLAPLLAVPPPDGRITGIQLKDLDETAWERFSFETCNALAEAVLTRVNSRRIEFEGWLRDKNIPFPFDAQRPITLYVSRRTLNCLQSSGLASDSSKWSDLTIGRLLSLRNFGIRSLVDLLTSLDSSSSEEYRTTEDVRAQAERLLNSKESKFISHNDPRFDLDLRNLAHTGDTLVEILEQIKASDKCPLEPAAYAKRLKALYFKIIKTKHLKFEEEIREVLQPISNAKNLGFILHNIGCEDGETHTLEATGEKFGVTRERARQICQEYFYFLETKKVFLPVLDRILGTLARIAPCTEDSAQKKMQAAGLTELKLSLKTLANLAELTKRPSPIIIERYGNRFWAVPPSLAGLGKSAVQLARKSISHWGAITIEDVHASLRPDRDTRISVDYIKNVICSLPEFEWLEEARGWFWFRATARNALLNQIEKVLAVSGQVHISELRSGVSRHHRRQGFAPPQQVLLEICKKSGLYSVEGPIVKRIATLNVKEILSDVEYAIYEALRERGGVLDRQSLEAECAKRGIKQDTFYAFLTYTPILACYAKGVYGIRGIDIPPGYAETMIPRRKRSRVLSDYGWLPNGNIFIHYQLTKHSVSQGLVHIPQALQNYLQGTFALIVGDGEQIGQLNTGGHSTYGLTAFFRRRGGEPGDTLTLVFDLSRKTATLELNQGQVGEDPNEKDLDSI